LVLDLPGITPESVSIEVDKGVLTLKTPVREAEETTYLRRERFHGAYERSVRLPDTIQEDAVNAYFENGVLTLVLPKKPEAQPIRIPVTTSNSR
jgi:HSP20 family protein